MNLELGCGRGVGGDEGLVGDGVYVGERGEGELGLLKEVSLRRRGGVGAE